MMNLKCQDRIIKICNFRPLCFLALIVIIAVASCMVSAWLTLVASIILVVTLYWFKLPTYFKITALVVFALSIFSFVLTTTFDPNPNYHTYDVNSGLRGIVLRYAERYLKMFLSENNAELLYSIMFGDKSGLPVILKNNFTVSGLAHVLAVSGMNVALLATVVNSFLKICKMPSNSRIWVLAPLLIFYAYLCGWQYSILRAVIMYLVYTYTKINLQLADSLSCLSFAAAVILILFPYSLLSASFLLSFSCMLGITFMYRFFIKFLYVKAIALYLSVTIATFPFVVYFFGYVPLYGIIANIVLVPLLSFSFCLGMFSISTYVMGAVLWIAEPLITFVRDVSSAIATLPYATIPITSSYPEIIIYLLGMIVMSRFIFIKPKHKFLIAGMLFACYFVMIMF